MGETLFAHVSQLLINSRSRRRTLQAFIASPFAAVLLTWLDADWSNASERRRHHHPQRQKPRAEADKHKKHKGKKKHKKQCSQTGRAPQSNLGCCSGLELDGSGICTTPSSPTCATTCAGCCAGETCNTGTSNDVCGTGGNTCTTCLAPATCAGGVCVCDVCGNGACAFTNLSDAIAAAPDGGTITICAGTHNAGAMTTIAKNVTIIGSGSGSDPASSTILDGTGSNASVLQISDDTTVSIQHLRIRGGTGTQPIAGSSSGGGIRNEGNLTLTGVVITENTANIGGGIHQRPNTGATVTLNAGTQIVGNTASG